MTVFFRLADGTLHVTRGPSTPAHTVSLDGLAEIMALRWCADREEVLAMAVPRRAESPDVSAGERGDVRVFRWRVRGGGWEEVHDGYTHDAVCVSGGGYTVHNGAGLAFLGSDGSVRKEVRTRRFNPAPPSLSASPGGDRVAWIRWRGDDRRICAQHVGDDAPTKYGVSCHRYAWLDDRSLVFYLGGPLRVLNLDSGESSTLLNGLVGAARGRKFGNRTLDRYLSGRVAEVEEAFAALRVVDGRISLAADLFSLALRWWWMPRFSGVFSIYREGGDIQLLGWAPKQELIKDVVGLADGSGVLHTERYRRLRVVDRPRRPLGPLADFLADGWEPMLTSCEAEFGFRTLPHRV